APVLHASLRLFRVIEEGFYAGRCWREGDVIACRDTVEPWGPVVLEARGHGRPRLGALQGRALFGDGGEPCSPLRWRVAGEVVVILRRDEVESGGSTGCATRAGWRAIDVIEGAWGALLDGVDVASVQVRASARAARSEPV